MAASYETMTDEVVALLEKAIKTKPKETKARIALHKKAAAAVKELQKFLSETVDRFGKNIDKGTRTMEEAVGVASSEVKLLDREIVRHLKRAIKRSKDIPRPKGWIDGYDKAVKAVAEWDPKAESVDALKEGIKYLNAGKTTLDAKLAEYRKAELETNAMFDKAIADLNSLGDARVTELLSPYFDRYREMFHPPEK